VFGQDDFIYLLILFLFYNILWEQGYDMTVEQINTLVASSAAAYIGAYLLGVRSKGGWDMG
jgi:hypothetical protein